MTAACVDMRSGSDELEGRSFQVVIREWRQAGLVGPICCPPDVLSSPLLSSRHLITSHLSYLVTTCWFHTANLMTLK
jgi:hypothetical protein